MTIKTENFKLSRKDLFLFGIRPLLPAMVMAVIVLLALAMASLSGLALSFNALLLGLIYPAIMAGACFLHWRQLGGEGSKNFYEGRIYELTPDGLSVNTDSGSHSLVKFQNLLRTERRRQHLLIYMSNAIFHLIPLSAFRSGEDAARFQDFLLQQGVPDKKAGAGWKKYAWIILFWLLLAIGVSVFV